MGKQGGPSWKDAPLVDEPSSNGEDVPKWKTAPLVEVKKKDVKDPESLNGTTVPGSIDSSKPAALEEQPSTIPTGKEKEWVDQVLQKNTDKEWVKRLYEPNTPTLTLPGETEPSTHFMESSDKMAYPTIVKNKDGKLEYLADKARDYAIKNKTFIEFPTDEEANWFAANGYKKGTGVLQSLEQQLETKRTENIEQVQAGTPKIEAGLTPLAPPKLGGEGKGIGQIGADILTKSFADQKESRAFLADQNKKLLGSIAESGKVAPVKQDVTKVKPLIKATEAELEENDQQFKDQESARIRQEEGTLNRVSSAAGTFDQTVVDTFAGILKSGAIAGANTIGRLGLSGQFGKATDPKQDWAYQLADWVEGQAKELFPENPAYQGEILSKTVPEVAGTLFSFMLSGALGQTTKVASLAIPTATKAVLQETAKHVPAAFMASASTAAGEYENALQATGDPETAMRTWERNMFTGLPFLVSPTFKAFDKATGGALKYGVQQFAQGGIAGGFQMGASHALTNLSAQETYDKTREIMDGVLKTGGSGFAINGVLTGLLAAIAHKAIGATPAEKAKYEQAIKEIQDRQAQYKDAGNTDYVIEPVGGVETKFKGMEGRVNQPSGDIGLTMPEVISEAKNDIKSTADTPTIEAKAAEIIEKIKATQEEGVKDVIQDEQRLAGQKREGEEPVKAEPEQGTSDSQAQGGGIFQSPPEETKVTSAEEAAPLLPEAKEGAKPIVADEQLATEGQAQTPTPEGSKGEELPNQTSPASEDISKITDPEEIARRYDEEVRNPKGTAIEDAIGNVLSGVGINPKSVERFGDMNAVNPAMKKKYLRDEGADMDALAQEASLTLTDGADADAITPEDVWEYMTKYPEGRGATPNKNPLLMELNNRHIELTGKGINKGGAKGRAEKFIRREELTKADAKNERIVKEFFAEDGEIDYKKAQEFLSSASAKDFEFPWDLTEAQFEQLKEYVDEKARTEKQGGTQKESVQAGAVDRGRAELTEEVQGSPEPPPKVNEATPTTGSNTLPGEKAGKPPTTTPPEVPPQIPGEEQTGSGIKKSLVPEEKVVEMADQLEQRTNEEFLEQGKKDVESGDINPAALVQDVVGHHRALQTNEVAALVYYKAKMDNRFDAINIRLQKIKSEGGDPSEATYLKNELQTLTEERDRFHEMQLITAREQGRAFGLRKMMLDNEYNLLSQINQYKAQSADGEIPPAVLEHFKAIDERLKKANERIAELERTAAEREKSGAEKGIKEKVRKERAPSVKRGKALIDEGLNDLKGISWDSSTGIIFDPKREAQKMYAQDKAVVKALSKIGRGLIDEGLATLENVAEKLKEYIQDKFKGLPFDKYQKEVTETITAGLPRPTVKDGKLRIPKSVIHDLVEGGIDTIEDLTKAIHDMVRPYLKDVTERQVRDAITEYGKTANLNKEEVATKVRELKRVGKLISMMEDVRKKLRPLRSGLQRDKLTDKERVMQRELREAMKDLPEDTAETERVWKTAIEATKSRLKNQITDLEEQIATGKKTPKKKGIVYDQEALALQAKRDELRDQLQAIEGKPELSDEQRLRMAVTVAQKSVKDYERRVKEGDFEAKKKREPVSSPELEEMKAKRDAAKDQLDKVREELGVAEKERLTKAKEAVKKSQEHYERRVKEKDFAAKEKTKIVADKELETAIRERDKAKFEFQVAQEKNRLANRPMSEKVQDMIIDTFNVPKSLISSIDLSAIFRQGLLLGVAHPRSVPGALKEMVKKMSSEKYESDWIHNLHQSDIYPTIRNSKLYVAEPHAILSAREENFVSRLVNKIPVIGSLVKGSQRAYTGYLNALRVDVFAKGVDQLKDAGYTEANNPKAFKDWAQFINNASGRGNLGAFEKSAPLLNTVFFSPRFLASRLNIMNPLTYAKMHPKVRRMAMADTLKYIAFGSTVLGMAAAAGADVETDPRSTDFGKIKIGNTRYDIWSGFQPIVRTIAQLASGQTKSASGEIKDLEPGFGKRTRIDVIGSFFRTKEAPTVSSLHNLAAGTNVIGEPVTPLGELGRNVIPLYAQDIANIYQNEGGPGVAASVIPALVGVGVQSYPSSGVAKDSAAAKVSADHDYYFSAPGRYSATFATPPTVQQYAKFLQVRGEEIIKQFDEHRENLSKSDNEHYKKRMDHYVKRATDKALFQAGIPEKSKHEEREPKEEEAVY